MQGFGLHRVASSTQPQHTGWDVLQLHAQTGPTSTATGSLPGRSTSCLTLLLQLLLMVVCCIGPPALWPAHLLPASTT